VILPVSLEVYHVVHSYSMNPRCAVVCCYKLTSSFPTTVENRASLRLYLLHPTGELTLLNLFTVQLAPDLTRIWRSYSSIPLLRCKIQGALYSTH